MAVNEVIINGETVIDLKSDTVTPEALAVGATAHNAAGEVIVGIMKADRLIEAAELPTQDIDEAAVYKTVEEELPEIWAVFDGNKIPFYQLVLPETIKVFSVEALPERAADTGNDIPVYVVKETGIAYAAEETMFIPVGNLLFSIEGLDRGWAEDIDNIDEAEDDNIGIWCVRGKEYDVYCTYGADGWVKHYSQEKTADAINELLSEDAQEYIVPEGVEKLKRGCFAFSEMNNVVLPDSLSQIGPYAFYGCEAITAIALPASLKTIEDNSFAECVALNNVIFSAKPDHISQVAFSGSDNLSSISVPWSENEVEGAPWGAVNATVNYDSV